MPKEEVDTQDGNLRVGTSELTDLWGIDSDIRIEL